MLVKSCGCVIFNSNKGRRQYLLLHHADGHWDFAKGHVEKNESEQETALREAYEETGLKDLIIMPAFREIIKYSYLSQGRKQKKKVVFFLAMTKKREIRLSDEHTESAWLAYEQAKNMLTFNNAKRLIEKAEKFMAKKEKHNITKSGKKPALN